MIGFFREESDAGGSIGLSAIPTVALTLVCTDKSIHRLFVPIKLDMVF